MSENKNQNKTPIWWRTCENHTIIHRLQWLFMAHYQGMENQQDKWHVSYYIHIL